jgi:IS4 transposase
VQGYRVRILDGRHLGTSDKRLEPLRDFRGAALLGQSLVVYDPDTGLPLLLRRIELALDISTEEGDTVTRLLTNLPEEKVDAKQVAQLYRRR